MSSYSELMKYEDKRFLEFREHDWRIYLGNNNDLGGQSGISHMINTLQKEYSKKRFFPIPLATITNPAWNPFWIY